MQYTGLTDQIWGRCSIWGWRLVVARVYLCCAVGLQPVSDAWLGCTVHCCSTPPLPTHSQSTLRSDQGRSHGGGGGVGLGPPFCFWAHPRKTLEKSLFFSFFFLFYPSNIFNHFYPSILFVGEAFAENSSSTSLQRVAVRRVVSLSSGYFLLKAFSTIT